MGKKRVVQKGLGEAKSAKSVSSGTAPLKRKKKGTRKVDVGRIYIKSSYNNTMITVTDEKGEVITWATAGSLGFSGPKKATPFAASKVSAAIVEKVSKTGPQTVSVYVSGVGPGRDSAIRSLAASGFEFLSINDVTPIPHNGARPRKARRL
jgi:small subunit ribosomal protein S11